MKMTVEQLKANGYLVTWVEGLGECLLVPREEFAPEWEVSFLDEGHACKSDVVDGLLVTFVVLWEDNVQGSCLLPSCSIGNFDCQNCPHPLIPQMPKGSLKPCDGTIQFCPFATGSSTWKPCSRCSLQNYACTHGGGTCSGHAIKWRRYVL